MTENIKLTPTQDLLLEVLIARYRLGEYYWTFESRHTKALESLESLEYITVFQGNTDNSVRASLTAKGIETFVRHSKYVSPLQEQIDTLEAAVAAYETIYGGNVVL